MIRFAYPTTNQASSPFTYTVDPDEHFRAMLHAEAMGWALSGVFHSHPTGSALPSVIDVAKALEPDWLYLIAAGSSLRGFTIRDGLVDEIELS